MSYEQAQQVIMLLSSILAALKPNGAIDTRLQALEKKLDDLGANILLAHEMERP